MVAVRRVHFPDDRPVDEVWPLADPKSLQPDECVNLWKDMGGLGSLLHGRHLFFRNL